MAGRMDASSALCEGVSAALSVVKVRASTVGLRTEPTASVAGSRSATDVITGAGTATVTGAAVTETIANVFGVVEGHAGSVQLA